MDEVMNNSRIRCNLTENDSVFLRPKKTKKTRLFSSEGKHATKENQNGRSNQHIKPAKQNKWILSKSFCLTVLMLSILFSAIGGFFVGVTVNKKEYLEISHYQESLIRSEAIADYVAQLEIENSEMAALRMDTMKDEAIRRNEEVTLFAKLFEGVRDWKFDANDLLTYGVCVWNRMRSSMFPNTIDEVLHQPDQWINFSDDNSVVADYHKIAEKLVDLLYNSEVSLCSTKYCWIEIKDGHLYLKDSFNNYPGMSWWRYEG